MYRRFRRKVLEPKNKIYKTSFFAKYNCNMLVCFEEHENGSEASKRERQMKKWKRDWKTSLINDINPNWIDISLNWSRNVNFVYKIKRSLPTQE